MDFAELNSYDIGGLSSAILRCKPSDSIHYIFCATGEGLHELHEDPTHALHYSNYIFIQSDEDVSTWLLSNQHNEDQLDVLVDCHASSTPDRPATPPEPRHRYLTPNAVSNCLQLNRREKLFQLTVLRPVGHQTHKILPFFFRVGPAHHQMFQTTLIRTIVGLSVGHLLLTRAAIPQDVRYLSQLNRRE